MLNDAILMAAQELAHQPRENRKIIFVISDGREYGSRASYAQVLKVLLTNEIAVYAIGVDSPHMPGLSQVGQAAHSRPGLHRHSSQVRQRHRRRRARTRFTRGHRKAYQQITVAGAQPVHPGLQHAQKPSSTFRDIEVRVKRPGLLVTAKHGYYPLPPQRELPPPATQQATGTEAPPAGSEPKQQQ